MRRSLAPQMLRYFVSDGAYATLPRVQVASAVSSTAMKPAVRAWCLSSSQLGCGAQRGARALGSEASSANNAEAKPAAEESRAAGDDAKDAENTASGTSSDGDSRTAGDEAKDSEAAEAPKDSKSAAEEPKAPTETHEERLQRELKEVEEMQAKKKKELLLALAEFENVKKSNLKEREARRKTAIANFAEKMVEIYENFPDEKSPSSEASKMSEQCQALDEGIKLTKQVMKTGLEKYGMTELSPTLGDPFANSRHEQVGSREATEDETVNTVVEIVETGWIYQPEKMTPVVLRKAKVKIASPAQAPPPPPQQQQPESGDNKA